MKYLSLLLALITSCAPTSLLNAKAAPIETKISMTVGNECITNIDIDDRVQFIILFSGLSGKNYDINQLRKDAARMLMEESIQIQELQRVGASIKEEAIMFGLNNMAQRINVDPNKFEDFLKEKGVKLSTVKKFITSQVYWPQYVQAMAQNKINISDSKIEQIQNAQKAQEGNSIYLLQEIFIPVASPMHESAARNTLKNIETQLKDGANFEMLAQQFSQNATAMQGGNMGWVIMNLLPLESQSIIHKMKVGTTTSPIRIDEGYVIYHLKDKRKPEDIQKLNMAYNLRQIIFRHDLAIKDKVIKQIKKCKSCEDLDSVLQHFPAIHVEKSTDLKSQNLPPQLAGLLENLKANTLSAPQEYPQGTMYLWICERKKGSMVMSAQEIRQALTVDALTKKSRALMNLLLKRTSIDVKDTSLNVR